MKKRMKGIKPDVWHYLLYFLVLLPAGIFGRQVRIVNLKTEYTQTPLGIDVKSPRFSWQMQSNERGTRQTGYRIKVEDENGKQMWQTQFVASANSLNVIYKGEPLRARTKYFWSLTVRDNDKVEHKAASWFETGLLDGDPHSVQWNDARWIGGGDHDMPLYAQYLSVFRLGFSVRFTAASGADRAAFIYGANDQRLMDRNKNLYNLQNKKDSSFIQLEIDISPLKDHRPARLNMYRVGYAPADNSKDPFKTSEIPYTLLNKENCHEKHRFYIASVFGDTKVYMDGQESANMVFQGNLNPLGKGGDYIAFPVLGDIGFLLPAGQEAIFSDIQVRNYRNPSNLIFSDKATKALFDRAKNISVHTGGGYDVKATGKRVIVTVNPSRNSMPMMRTSFSSASGKIRKARLYVTARGVYQMYINGKRIGNDYLTPGLTQYNKTLFYQTYDVTENIKSGQNAMGAILAEGWWSGGATYMGQFWNFFGDRQSLKAQLIISYADGKEKVIVSSPATWKYFNNGPAVYGSLFQGAVYDATREKLVNGWSSPGFSDSLWHPAEEVPLYNYINTDKADSVMNIPAVDHYNQFALTAQIGPGIGKFKELTAIHMDEVRPGVFVYDMGQNMAGVPKIVLNGQAPGQKITLRYAEVRYPEKPEDNKNRGMLMLENIRAAMAQDIYITKGGREFIHPMFTYHGYRYIEITGISKPLPLEDVKGEVLSSVQSFAADYTTSSDWVNRLWKNIRWSALANFMSIPTDCPQRNERLGWSGDISVFARTATYLSNLPQFFARHMLAMRDVQRPDGRFSDVAPLGGGFGGPLWGSAGITVAWESYQQYGDRQILSDHYPAMKSYIDYLFGQIDSATGVLEENKRAVWGELGDWLSPVYSRTEKSLLWEAYFIYDLDIMQEVARLLNKQKDALWYNRLMVKRKAFFNTTYVDNKTGKTCFRGKPIDTETSYVLPLQFQVFNAQNEQLAKAHLVAAIERENKADDGTLCPPFSLMTGFIGTAWISSVLSDIGRSDMAYRLLEQKGYPSWLYPVSQGATTIWERLDSYTESKGFGGNNHMNSFNHYSFGAVGAWLYAYSLGIRRDERSPGFKHFLLAPEPDPTKSLTYAAGYYESMYGRISSSWKMQGNSYLYTFEIPANTAATVYLSASAIHNILSDGKLLQNSQGVKYLGSIKGKFVFELPSGRYDITVKESEK